VAARWAELVVDIADEAKRPAVHNGVGILLDSGAIVRVPETLLGLEFDGKWRFLAAPHAKDWGKGTRT
jgi:hypothetical protein